MAGRGVSGSVWAFAGAVVLCAAAADRPQPGAMAAQQAAPATREAAARHVDRGALMAVVRTLSGPDYAGRRTGTAGADAARTFIVGRFQEAGVAPAFRGGYLQRFEIARDRTPLPGGRGTDVPCPAANVAGLVPGTHRDRPFIVVSAHFDHLGIQDGVLHPGADDNASGVAVLLAAARHFTTDRPRHSMMFVAFDAEEVGLAGARTFVRDPPVPLRRIALNVNLDMVARSDRREIFAAGVHRFPWLEPMLRKVQARSPVRIRLGHDRPVHADSTEDWTPSSDHAAFHEAGVPFLYFGVEDHPDYHGPGDTADKVDPVFFGDVADMVVDTLIVLDRDL